MSGDVIKRKVVTVCGSMRFADRIAAEAERLEIEHGYAVIAPIDHVIGRGLTESEVSLLGELHLAKIGISDAIFVVNVGGYVGDAVRREIEYAKAHGKEIMYLE